MTDNKNTKPLLCCECQYLEEIPGDTPLRNWICEYETCGLFIPEPWEKCRYGLHRGFNDLLIGIAEEIKPLKESEEI